MARDELRAGHYLEWILLRWLISQVNKGSMADAYRRIQRLTRYLARPILRSEWAWANANLHLVYGDNLSAQQRDFLARRAFENILFSHVEGLRAWDTAFDTTPAQPLIDATALGRPMIIAAIHIGAWEPGMYQIGKLGVPLTAVYRHANNPLSEREFQKARDQYGIGFIRRNEPRAFINVLKRNQALGLMLDINVKRNGITAPFLGVDAQCAPGTARLAARFQALVVPVMANRNTPGHATLRALPALEPPAKRADTATLQAFTAKINASVAPWVHEYAEQYNWLHSRWRSRSDGTLWKPEDALAHKRPHAEYAPLSKRVENLINQSVKNEPSHRNQSE
ncbi:MAG: hypothetical protein HQL54_12185 [Magnetococcales bacterium]|nr:hypothetical protein [Magnetococcales bacterium]